MLEQGCSWHGHSRVPPLAMERASGGGNGKKPPSQKETEARSAVPLLSPGAQRPHPHRGGRKPAAARGCSSGYRPVRARLRIRAERTSGASSRVRFRRPAAAGSHPPGSLLAAAAGYLPVHRMRDVNFPKYSG
ncbi:hypothetical protein B8V81_2499 [Paenibacillus pasadenensis]|uniref:Uncharacterized protein n=1 Tax=Paenibacillus pasadenensis TaxID=217090 RepID=A0A2N5N151_9BACL|nr:hypothetical protein B8V81_2499 [Paenibacillus pasadenensis]